MFKIVFSKISEMKIKNFISFLKSDYKRFFLNSGMGENEDIIINMYLKNSEKLYFEIKKGIDDTIKKGVFGQISSKTEDYEETKLVIFIRSYIVICYCRKWSNEKVISIEDILIKT